MHNKFLFISSYLFYRKSSSNLKLSCNLDHNLNNIQIHFKNSNKLNFMNFLNLYHYLHYIHLKLGTSLAKICNIGCQENRNRINCLYQYCTN